MIIIYNLSIISHKLSVSVTSRIDKILDIETDGQHKAVSKILCQF